MPEEYPPLFANLPAASRAEIARRLYRAGIPLALHRLGRSYPLEPFFFGDGCYFYRGRLWYTAERTNADTLVHEACHALQLSPDARASWTESEIRTSEEATMALQIELWRGVPSVGVGRALRWMEAIGYSYGVSSKTDSERGIRLWWKYAKTDLPSALPWEISAHA